MCEPGSAAMGIASLVMAVVGTGVSMYSSYQEGKAQQSYYDYQVKESEKNAKIAEMNAATERQGGIEDARMQRMKTQQAIGSQQVALASNGIDITGGSALDIIEDTAAMGELDALNIETKAERTAQNYLQQANNYSDNAYLNTIAGKNAYSSGVTNAFGDLISGAASTAKGLGNIDKINPDLKTKFKSVIPKKKTNSL